MKSRKHIVLIIAMITVLLAACTVCASATTNCEVNVKVKYYQTDARSQLSKLNAFRTGSQTWYWNKDNKTKTWAKDLDVLEYDYELEKMAMQRAAEIALSMEHPRPNGEGCFTARSEDYYTNAAAENLMSKTGACSASTALECWKETDKDYDYQGHRRAMLSNKYTHVGIAHVYYNGAHYWVQEFARPGSGLGKTSANDTYTVVSIECDSSRFTSSSTTLPTITSCSVGVGKSYTLPLASGSVKFAKTFSSAKVPVSFKLNWTVADTSVARVENNKLIGVANGTTTAKGTINGKTVKITVNVRTSISDGSFVLEESDYVYDGTAKKPAVSEVMLNETTPLTLGVDYKVSYSSNTGAGTAKAIVTGIGEYCGTMSKTFTIGKATQKIAITSSSKKVKYSKTKDVYTSAVTVSGAKGTKKFVKTGGSSKLSISSTTGKIRVKKGTKKGTYSISVKVTSTSSNYYTATATRKIKVKVY